MNHTGSARHLTWFLGGALALSLVLAFGVSRFASSEPDGLEKVAEAKGLDAHEQPHDLRDTTFADYRTSAVPDEDLGTGIAGVVGVVATFTVTMTAVWLAPKVRDRMRPADRGASPQ